MMRKLFVEAVVLVVVLAMVVIVPRLFDTPGPSVPSVVLLGVGWVAIRFVVHAARHRRHDGRGHVAP